MKKKDLSTINDSVYYESDEQVDTIIYSNQQAHLKNNPIEETHIVDRVRNLSVVLGLFEPAVIEGRIGPITNVLDNVRVELSLNRLSPLNTNTLKTFVIGSACKSVGFNRNITNCTLPDSRTI